MQCRVNITGQLIALYLSIYQSKNSREQFYFKQNNHYSVG